MTAPCSLSGPLVSFSPTAPGVPETPYNGSGFAKELHLYRKGITGSNKIMLNEAWGYSTYDISNPVNPTRTYSHDVRFPIRPSTTQNDLGWYSVSTGGDGQSATQGFAVSPDGQRASLYMGGASVRGWGDLAADPSGEGFKLKGSARAAIAGNGQAIQQVNGRYIIYTSQTVTATDITNLPVGGLTIGNITNTENYKTKYPSGLQGMVRGNYFIYKSQAPGVTVINISNPGPVGSIMNNMPFISFTSSDFGGRNIQYFTASVDPLDSSKLWLLFELQPLTGENSFSYCLSSLTSNFIKSIGNIWRVPSLTGETYTASGISASLAQNNGNLYALMWATRSSPSSRFQLYSTTATQWANVNTTVLPGVFEIPTTQSFAIGASSECLSIGNNIYMYLPTGSAAFVIPMLATAPGSGGSGGVVPGPPTGLGITKLTNTSVRLSWTPPV